MQKAMCSLPLQKNVSEENLFFHHVPSFRIPPNYVCKLPKEWSSKWRNVFFGQMFSRDAGISSSRTFSETNNIVIPRAVKLLCLLSFEVCFCRDILPSFCLVRLFTSASNGMRLKTMLVSRIRILSFCPLFNFTNNSYLCIVIRTDEAHSIISSVIIVIIVIMLIIMIIGIIMVPCNHSSDISFLPSAVPSFLSPRVSPSHSLLRAYRQHSLNHQKSVYLAL